MVWNWNFLLEKWRRLVTWSRYWFVFTDQQQFLIMSAKLKNDVAISVTCRENLFVKVSHWSYHSSLPSLGHAKILFCCLATFQSNLLMNRLKCHIGVVLNLKCFWWIFALGEAKFHYNTKSYSGNTTQHLTFIFDQN